MPSVVICLLLYLQFTTSHPLEVSVSPEQYKLPLKDNASPEEINNMSELPAHELNSGDGEDVESLIDKVKEVTSRYKKDVDGTIAEVQQVLEKDYNLPKLTRGEIVEILDNLTKTDFEELRKGSKSRKDYQRALMLVMPYTSKDSRFNVEELYTKPPVTHIIGAHTVKPMIPKKSVEVLGDTTVSENISAVTPTTGTPTTVTLEVTRMEESTLRTPTNKRPVNLQQKVPEKTTEQKPIEIEITTPKSKKQFLINKQNTKPDFVASTHKPIYTTTTRYLNHNYQEDVFLPSNQDGFRIVNPPSFGAKPTTDYWEQKPRVPVRKTKPNTNRVSPVQSSVYKAPLASPSRRRYTTTTPYTTTELSILNVGVPEDMKDIVKDIQLADSIKKNKYSSQYVASEIDFQKPSTTTEDIQDILGAIGAIPTTKMPDLSGVADTLTPDMKELLMSFGLIEDPNRPHVEVAQVPSEPEIVDIKPISYTQFKPLPDSAPARDDMYELLSSYGLIGSQRSAKKIKQTKEYEAPKHLSEVPEIDMEMIPESMHGVLEDIGLTRSNRRGKRIETNEVAKASDRTHVFNPVESNVSSEELRRLNQLMETLVRLEKLNRTVTEEDFRDVDLENIAEITKILSNTPNVASLEAQSAPDPLDFDLGVEKNEVKRQESTTKKAESSSTTTEEPRNPPISALEESFGGAPDTKAEDATLPPPRRTGFYFLVDWNTFKEVGEEGKNKVSIRFSPKAGDPSRFLKVTVP